MGILKSCCWWSKLIHELENSILLTCYIDWLFAMVWFKRYFSSIRQYSNEWAGKAMWHYKTYLFDIKFLRNIECLVKRACYKKWLVFSTVAKRGDKIYNFSISCFKQLQMLSQEESQETRSDLPFMHLRIWLLHVYW